MADFIDIGVKEDSPEKLAWIAENSVPAKYYVSAEDIMLIVWAINQLKASQFTGDYEDLTNVPPLFTEWVAGVYAINKTVFHNNGLWINTINNNTTEPVIGSESWKLLAQINAGGVLGVDWENITGNQPSVNLSGFTNDGNGIYPFVTTNDLNNLIEELGGGRSDNNYSDADKAKLENLVGTRFVGTFPLIDDLLAMYPSGVIGGYADVGVPGDAVVRYNWSQSTFEWVTRVDSGAEINPSEYDLGEFANNGENPFVKNSDLIEAMETLSSLSFLAVEELPEEGDPNIIYLVPNEEAEGDNIKDEYIWISGDWELIGSTALDLSNYVQKSDITGAAGQLPFTDAEGAEIELRKIRGTDFNSYAADSLMYVWRSSGTWELYQPTQSPSPNTVVIRTGTGAVKSANAVDSNDAVNLGQATTLLATKLESVKPSNVDGISLGNNQIPVRTSSDAWVARTVGNTATANEIPIKGTGGRMVIGQASANNEATTLGQVNDLISPFYSPEHLINVLRGASPSQITEIQTLLDIR